LNRRKVLSPLRGEAQQVEYAEASYERETRRGKPPGERPALLQALFRWPPDQVGEGHYEVQEVRGPLGQQGEAHTDSGADEPVGVHRPGRLDREVDREDEQRQQHALGYRQPVVEERERAGDVQKSGHHSELPVPQLFACQVEAERGQSAEEDRGQPPRQQLVLYQAQQRHHGPRVKRWLAVVEKRGPEVAALGGPRPLEVDGLVDEHGDALEVDQPRHEIDHEHEQHRPGRGMPLDRCIEPRLRHERAPTVIAAALLLAVQAKPCRWRLGSVSWRNAARGGPRGGLPGLPSATSATCGRAGRLWYGAL
jgi:hypothetical protein